MTDRLGEMTVFLSAAETGSFAAAARDLGLSPQMVGKRVAAIEQRLGARLINRSTRHQSLTEAGHLYREGCRRTLAELQAAEAEVAAQATRPHGLLRVTAPVAFGTLRLVPDATRFLADNPEIRMDVELTDRRVDPVAEGFDAAIRIGDEPDSGLIGRALAPYRLVACAAPAYIARRGMPLHPDDLREHECLGYTFAAHPGPSLWRFPPEQRSEQVAVEARLVVNDSRALIEAALDGFGIALAAETLVEDHLAAGRLVRVLADHEGPVRPMRLLYAARSAQPLKLRAFIAWVCEVYASRASGINGRSAVDVYSGRSCPAGTLPMGGEAMPPPRSR